MFMLGKFCFTSLHYMNICDKFSTLNFNMHNLILITGIGGPAGKSAISYLQKSGFRIIGTDMMDVENPATTFYKIPAAGDPSFSRSLLNIIKNESPSLLIPTVTEELPIVSRLKDIIEDYGCTVFISNYNAVKVANDKMLTAQFMSDHGIPAPKSLNGNTPQDHILKELGIPMLSKPRIGRGGRGVRLYHAPEEFYKETRGDLVYQEFIPGEEFDLNLFLDKKGKVLSGVVLKKIILKNGIIGNAVAVERVERDDIMRLGIKIANLLEMEGPLDMDIRLRKDRTPVLLEINARVGGNVLSAPEILDSLIKAWETTRCTH